MEQFNINDFYITIFKASTSGVEIISSDILPINGKKNEYQKQVLLNMGIMLFSALGAGHKYYKGLYGPFPFIGNEKYSTLVYALILSDSHQADHRLNSQSYCLICFTYPAEINPDRLIIDKALKPWTISDISKLNESEIENLRKMFIYPES